MTQTTIEETETSRSSSRCLFTNSLSLVSRSWSCVACLDWLSCFTLWFFSTIYIYTWNGLLFACTCTCVFDSSQIVEIVNFRVCLFGFIAKQVINSSSGASCSCWSAHSENLTFRPRRAAMDRDCRRIASSPDGIEISAPTTGNSAYSMLLAPQARAPLVSAASNNVDQATSMSLIPVLVRLRNLA